MINKGILIDRQFDAELFADNLRLLREGKGLTQAELGSLCGISENAIRNYELGRCFPKITTLNALADALDVSVGSTSQNMPYRRQEAKLALPFFLIHETIHRGMGASYLYRRLRNLEGALLPPVPFRRFSIAPRRSFLQQTVQA